MSELDATRIRDLSDLNARLWAWLETVYHRTAHGGLDGQTPLARYQQDLAHIRTLGAMATRLDALFHHRVTRLVRNDGTVSYLDQRFEVPYELSGQSVRLVVDPHTRQVIGVEDDNGESLGAATPLDALANVHRRRRQPRAIEAPTSGTTDNAVEMAYRDYYDHTEEAD